MSLSKLENLVHQSFDEFYRQRILKLTGVMLGDLFRKKNLYLLCATSGSSVSKIVEKMLEEYLLQFDESIFGDTFFESIERIESERTVSTGEKSDSIFKAIALIDLIRTYPTQNRLDFVDGWANTLNRFEQEFLNNFGNPDGSIDWEKLLRYNSGKDNVPWVTKVIPVTSAEDQEDEIGDVDDGIEDNV